MRRYASRPVIHALLMTTAAAWSIDIRTPVMRPMAPRAATAPQMSAAGPQNGMPWAPPMYRSTSSGSIGEPNRKP